jgi:hypothetical protein
MSFQDPPKVSVRVSTRFQPALQVLQSVSDEASDMWDQRGRDGTKGG